MSHELTSAFENAGVPLNRKLVEMLDESSVHRTERRGCGFTQATRFLAELINQPRKNTRADDLSLFANVNKAEVEGIALSAQNANWRAGWRSLEYAPPSLQQDLVRQFELAHWLISLGLSLQKIRGLLRLEESLLFFGLMADLLSREGEPAPTVAGMVEKPNIGSCSQAEEFFLEIVHGKIRRGGSVNIIVSSDGSPLMVEKMNLGESHSALVVSPVKIFGVWIPSGSLCALKYPEGIQSRKTLHGNVITLENVTTARFLRLTTLSVEPRIRRRAFSQQLETQVRMPMLSPQTTTIEQISEFALAELRER